MTYAHVLLNILSDIYCTFLFHETFFCANFSTFHFTFDEKKKKCFDIILYFAFCCIDSSAIIVWNIIGCICQCRFFSTINVNDDGNPVTDISITEARLMKRLGRTLDVISVSTTSRCQPTVNITPSRQVAAHVCRCFPRDIPDMYSSRKSLPQRS